MTLPELTLEEAEEALAHVDPHSRDVWLRMAMALKSEFGDGAFEAWDRWSAQAQNYRERDARTQWRSVKPHGRVGIGTLIHHAKAGGWQPRRRERSEAERRDLDERQKRRQQERRVAGGG
ncbi:PriCT-2 domain-containing protein [Spiribacter halobius]|uniref:PriCT-2 domain-containing protein n=1 Tax=Sediminicurvatus halobius TaxID=2182432 RepID=UPI001E4CDF1B|nr:PriCT-2 domain-containing protein [Spiribacter halobius]UEX76822.1 PriCT-2 domain-containing protein [Spiribacter halobius]